MKYTWMLFMLCIILLPVGESRSVAATAVGQAGERGIPPDWQVEHIYGKNFTNMGPRSLAVDTDDKLYLAYGGDHLYFTTNDGSGWTAPDVIDPDWGVGQGVSLAVDSDKKVHISYVDTSYSELRYTTNKTGSWIIQTLLNGGVGLRTALVLDTGGKPHILYHAPASDSLGYFYLQADGNWNNYPVNSSGEGGAEVSLAIDSDDRLRATYYREKTIDFIPNGCLEYQTQGPGGWAVPSYEICQPIGIGGAGRYNAIGLNTYYDKTHTIFNYGIGLAYAYNPGWTEIDQAACNGLTAMSIVVDGQNQGHIAYRTNNIFRYTIHDESDFLPPSHHTIDTSTVEAGDFVSLVLDSTGHPHAAYTRQDHKLLSSWHDAGLTYWETPVTIDQEDPLVGECTQLAFSSNGTAHLTFYDSKNQYISYARRPAGGSWNLGLAGLHTVQDLDCQHSMKLNGDVPSIAYTTVDLELRYATYGCDPFCSWSSEHVADNVYYPESVSLAFTSTGKPRISFIESNTPSLAYNDGYGWLTSGFDYMTASGQTSLAIDSNNKIHVAYFRATAHDLYYIVQNGSNPVTWFDPQLVDDENAGTYVSLALSSAFNLGRIAYAGQNGSTLKYTVQNLTFPSGTFWGTPETVYSLLVESPILVLDSGSQPQIYYYKDFDTHLQEAYKPGSDWVNRVLDANGMVGHRIGGGYFTT